MAVLTDLEFTEKLTQYLRKKQELDELGNEIKSSFWDRVKAGNAAAIVVANLKLRVKEARRSFMYEAGAAKFKDDPRYPAILEKYTTVTPEHVVPAVVVPESRVTDWAGICKELKLKEDDIPFTRAGEPEVVLEAK